MDDALDPLVPRPLDRPRAVPLEAGADLTVLDTGKILAAPDDPAHWPAWREQLTRWRDEARVRQGYDGSLYDRPDLAWTRGCFAISQVWLWDELLYDWETHTFTAERLLADAERFGGFDAVVLWHAYPVIGIDDRNQWDYYRDVDGLDDLVDALHAAGVKVFIDYNPWDVGTRRSGPDAVELASLVGDLGIDGVFLDTLKEGGGELLERLDDARPGVAVEGESTLPLARLVDHPMSWAQWFADSPVPGVVRSHLYERRHLLHHVRRWHRSHVEEVQSAWLNGIGVMVWEVVFGVWVGWSDHDAELLRRASTAQRALADVLAEGEWTPLPDLGPEAVAAGVFGGQFAHTSGTFVPLVNRSDAAAEVRLPGIDGLVAHDLWSGARLGEGEITVRVPARGIGGAWLTASDADTTWLRPGDDAVRSRRFTHRPARRIESPTVHLAATPAAADGGAASPPPVDHVLVEPGDRVLTVRYRCRETGLYDVAPFVDEWKPLPPRLHDLRTVDLGVSVPTAVAVAHLEVSELDFAEFVAATGHAPAVPGGRTPAWVGRDVDASSADRPVTEVDLADARAYAAWVGGRLPTEHEWQLAAEEHGLGRRTPEVWNLTDSEHTDGRSRFIMLKGGSAHRSTGSDWYFDGGVRTPDFTAKYLVPGLGSGRSTSIGFRCAWPQPTGGTR